MNGAVHLEALAAAARESFQILGATALLSLFAFPAGLALAFGNFGERNPVMERVLAAIRRTLDAAVPLIVLLLILYPAPYKKIFAFAPSSSGATAWSLAFLFSFRFALALEELLRAAFYQEREILLAVGASPLQTCRLLVSGSRHLWIRHYFGSCAAVVGVTSGAGLTQLAYEKGYFFFQTTSMILIGVFLAALSLSIDRIGHTVAQRFEPVQ